MRTILSVKSIVLFLILATFVTCKRDSIGPAHPTTDDKKLLSFEITAEKNKDYLANTVKGTLTDSTIELYISSRAVEHPLIANFEFKGSAVYVDEQLQESGVTQTLLEQGTQYIVVAPNGSLKIYKVDLQQKIELDGVLPHIYIDVDNGDKITSREDYIQANISIDGKGVYPDYEGQTKIRGRGNSTWNNPKKPYKLKLTDPAPLFNLAPYKKWILLAEYLDGSMLYNAIPFTTAQMLHLPYTNHIIPVEITLNGEDQGIYVFTEHKEVGENRIDIGDDGLLLELDTYFDESLQFKSENYELPVMIKYPQAKNMSELEAENQLERVQTDWNNFEGLVYDSTTFPDNNYLAYFDEVSYVRYLIVNWLTDNEEINAPHSTYINRPYGQKYHMGIVWDFDWGYGYSVKHDGERSHYTPSSTTHHLFWMTKDTLRVGTQFLARIMDDPQVQQVFKQEWENFRSTKYAQLVDFVKEYAEIIRIGYDKDHAIWGKRDSTGDLDEDLQKVLDWLDARANYIDGIVNDFSTMHD